MFKNKKDSLEPETSVRFVEIPEKEIILAYKELLAWNCLVFHAEKNDFPRRIFLHPWEEVSFSVTEIEYAIWLLESKNYSGISEDVAKTLNEKLKKSINVSCL